MDINNIADFSSRLKKLRIKKGLKQNEVADTLGITHATYNRYEKGVSQPKSENILKLANFFEVTPTFLLYGEENNPFKEIITTQDKSKQFSSILTEIPQSNLIEFLEQSKEDFNEHYNKINLILTSLEANKINYEIIEYQTQNKNKLPLEIKISYQNTNFNLDIDDLLYIYNMAKGNFDNSIKNIIDIISTFKNENEEQQ